MTCGALLRMPVEPPAPAPDDGPGPAAVPAARPPRPGDVLPVPRPAFRPVTIRTTQDTKTAAAQYLHDHGVPDDAILRETTGRSSWESLAASARFLTERDMTKVVLVSDPYHAARIDAIASEVGLDAVTSPTRTSPIRGKDEWRRFATETLRVAAGRVFGFRRLDRGRDVGDLVPGLAML